MALELSVNHYICGDALSFPAFASAVRDSGITSVGVTRAAIAEMGLAGLETCLSDNGLSVSSVNSAGYFTPDDPNPIAYSNQQLIDVAARLKADVLCVIAGGLGQPPLPLTEAHLLVADGLADLAGRAAGSGVKLGLEPVYPGDILTKGCVNSCAHGLEVVAPHDNVGLMLDLYHSWWDPGLPELLNDHADQVALIQLSNLRFHDGLVAGRAPLRAGGLDLSGIMNCIAASDYAGKLEFELFSRDLAGRDPRAEIAAFPGEVRGILPEQT